MDHCDSEKMECRRAEEEPLDWTTSRYFVHFGFGLVVYLTASLGVLLLLRSPGEWKITTASGITGLGIAVFIRVWKHWRGFLLGAALALVFAAALQVMLYWYLKLIWHGGN